MSKSDAAVKALREFGLTFPGAGLKSPWPGHKDLAVKDKTFAYLSIEGEPFSIGCKLPESSASALMLPFCEPTPYGLGKSGWVTAKFKKGDAPPVELFKKWIIESYRAQAPKTLLKQWLAKSGEEATAAPKKKPKAAKKKTVRRA